MDFFSAQDQARRKTRWLIFLFVVAIVSLVVLTNLFIMLFAEYSTDYYVQDHTPATFWDQFNWQRFTGIGLGVTAVILMGSFIRSLSLRGGGRSVAEMMGGRLVSGNPRGPLEQRLLNVVDEIAIASGTPVPQVYVMDGEAGINAFAAGFTSGDAVVAVTRGTLEKLNRAELQGVIAHEFSHIVNGDMRLNIRLIGVLFGILMVALIGRLLFRWGALSSSSSRDNNGGLPLILLGLGLLILGYVGVFFGNLIKASVSRQREYLADASAVQFTREPAGIAGALKKIGGDVQGSLIVHPDAEELSHAYFGEGIHYHLFNSLFATHPPLEQRIRRIEPHWDGNFIVPQPVSAVEAAREEEQHHRLSPETIAAGTVILTSVLDNIENAGVSDAHSIGEAERLLEAIPDELRRVAREPHGARALIYALVLDDNHAVLEKQIWHLRDHADTGVAVLTERYMNRVGRLSPKLRLALVDLAMPALRQLSQAQFHLFKENLNVLIEMDDEISPFEWALQKIVLHNLEVEFEHRIPPVGRYGNLHRLKREITVMLSYLVHNTQEKHMDRLHAFQAGARELEMEGLQLLDEKQVTIEVVDKALDRLAMLKPLLKPRLLKACAACVAADGKVTTAEMELLRAFSSLLDCPLPPLPEQ